ncbi:MAG: xanthine dehydrogenase family protein molybdopterin-binding subunit [Nocardioidaceae bacterium]|nr:xanthine dehydrogenase family protein molybdopterin-binding subunit [Nocardioidaceae bacterium]
MTTVQAAPFIRPDGKEKVTGLGRYTADINLTGQAHAAFRYADHPHARITRIDTTAARAIPGVYAVVTHEDVPENLYGGMVQDRLMFAKDTVRWEGDVVAGVAARTQAIAREAAAAIVVDYDVLPPLPDYVANATADAPLVHAGWTAYSGEEEMGRDGNVVGHSTIVKGDAAAAMAGADVVVRSHYRADASQGAPIEPRAILAQWNGDRVTIWSSTQVPFAARDGVAHVLGIPQSHVRVIVPLLGGGFGSKCDFHFEGHVAALAKAAKRPVKLVFSRREEFFAPDHRREGLDIDLETGVTRDGHIVARRATLHLDKGAYTGEGGFFAQMAAMHACGPYELDNVEVRAMLTYSTNQPSSSIRAPTAPQVCWALEQHMDEVAAELGLDPVELRRRTLIDTGSVSATGQVFDEIGMKQTLEAALEMIGYGEELPEDEAIGVACGWWPSMASPSGAYVKLNGDGTATIVTGAQECGTGAVMALPVLAAEQLGMKPEDFSILYQDTDAGPWDMGASGSQTTFNNGRAVIAAAIEVRSQLLEMASERLEVGVDDLELVDGAARVKGAPSSSVTIAELAGTGTPLLGKGSGVIPDNPPTQLPEGCVGKIGIDSFLAPQLITQAARVKVDRETGVVRVVKFAAAHDSGVIINKIGADGQVFGGVMMGIGQALTEATWTDEDGRQRNPGLLDYKLQTASDAPEIEVRWIEIDTPNAGPKGSKGVGEPPSVPTSGAVGNAIAKVIGRRVRELPMTPERVWAAANGIGANGIGANGIEEDQ